VKSKWSQNNIYGTYRASCYCKQKLEFKLLHCAMWGAGGLILRGNEEKRPSDCDMNPCGWYFFGGKKGQVK